MIDLIEQGGFAMIPLILGSVAAFGIGMVRLVYFLRLERGGPAFRQRLLELLKTSKPGEALDWLQDKQGIVPATARAAAERWTADGTIVQQAMESRARLEARELYRYLPFLETTVTAAPLVGLLGTITGMMSVFRTVAGKLANDPHANTSGITAGIGEALIATATGILVAVIALFIHNSFQSWAEAHLDEAERVADELKLAHYQKSGDA